MTASEYLTIIGYDDETGETRCEIVPYDLAGGDPHLAALRHTARRSQAGEYAVFAVLRGACQLLVTQQSLQLYTERLLAK